MHVTKSVKPDVPCVKRDSGGAGPMQVTAAQLGSKMSAMHMHARTDRNEKA
jgi:hypothetical protein